jgi:hypothetical protein
MHPGNGPGLKVATHKWTSCQKVIFPCWESTHRKEFVAGTASVRFKTSHQSGYTPMHGFPNKDNRQVVHSLEVSTKASVIGRSSVGDMPKNYVPAHSPAAHPRR